MLVIRVLYGVGGEGTTRSPAGRHGPEVRPESLLLSINSEVGPPGRATSRPIVTLAETRGGERPFEGRFRSRLSPVVTVAETTGRGRSFEAGRDHARPLVVSLAVTEAGGAAT
jgi:hypothetical protein